MVRAIDQLDPQPVANVSGAYAPFFSPDNRWIGFFENTELKKVSIAGGPAITLCQFSGSPLGASWGDDHTVTFATNTPGTGLWRVPEDGGEPTLVTTADPGRHEGTYSFPSLLPRGRGVLFTIATSNQADRSVAVLDLKTGQRKTLIRGGGDAQHVETGHLIFAAAGELRAVRFDPVRLEVLGDPVTVVDHVMMKPTVAANYTVSRAGRLVYIAAGLSEQATPRKLVWVDRKGHEEPSGLPPRAYGNPRLSPDGTRVAVEVYDQNADIWIWDLAKETLRRLTFDSAGDGLSNWTPIVGRSSSYRAVQGVPSVYKQAADGSGTVDRLSPSATPHWPTAIAPDGRWVAGFDLLRGAAQNNIVFLPLTRTPGSDPVRDLKFNGSFSDFSPNGRYLAYQSEESGHDEMYVRPFPRVDNGRWQVSTAGGARPCGRGAAASCSISTPRMCSPPCGSTPPDRRSTSALRRRCSTPGMPSQIPRAISTCRLTASDSSCSKPCRPAITLLTPASMVVVEQWFEELRQRVPANGK